MTAEQGKPEMSRDERRAAIDRILGKDPATSQREIARVLGCSQKTIGRDIAAMTQTTHAGSQGVPPQVRRADSRPRSGEAQRA